MIDVALILDMVVQKCIAYHFTEPLWFRVSYPFFWHPIKGILLSATIFMVIAVSAERFRAICYPFSDRHVSDIPTLYYYSKHTYKKHYISIF